jgi:DNA polymerase III sliding clamp (beta) subunit (PCNA family)
MKIKSKSLRSALESACKLSRSTANPMSAYLRLKLDDDLLKISSTNLEEWHCGHVKIEDADNSTINCCVLPRHLSAALALAGEFAEINQDKGILTVDAEATFRVKCLDGDEFIPEPSSKAKPCDIACADLASAIKAVEFCAHNSPARLELASVHIFSEDGKLFAEAADGGNGAFASFPCAVELNALVSTNHSSRLAAALFADGAQLSISDGALSVKHNLGAYQCRLLEAKYPNTDRIRKGEDFQPSKPLGTVDPKVVAETLSAALMMFETNELPSMSVSFGPKGAILETQGFKRTIPGKFGEFSTQVNAQAFKKCISAFSGESANIATGNLDFLHFSSGNLNVFSMSLRK